MLPLVVLLRAEEEDERDDFALAPPTYREALSARGFDVSFLPVLDTEVLDAAPLISALSAPLAPSVIVVTSARAARAFSAAAAACGAAVLARLAGVPAFAVGPRTASVLRNGPCAEVLVGGGTAASLAPAVAVRWRARCSGVDAPPVLFLCGDKRLDALPAGLAAARVPCRELVVYATAPCPPGALAVQWAALTAGRCGPVAVVFSPAGLRAALAAGVLTAAAAVVAIGPTTAAACASESVACSATAASPDPPGVADAVVAAAASVPPAAACIG